MSLLPLFIDVGTTIEEASGLLQYALVFVFAAIPIVEILVVVPIAIGLGLNPVLTAAFAFAGNVGSVYALILTYRRLLEWWAARRGDDGAESGDRYARARQLWDRYGLPGVSLGGPILTGVHIAAFVALLAGSPGRAVAAWMTMSIAVWTVALTAASVAGLSLLGLA
jgi:uncharacterized SAM-binding protein YcdF (DUF218 family)